MENTSQSAKNTGDQKKVPTTFKPTSLLSTEKLTFLLDRLEESAEIPGAALEIGVFNGGTLAEMADVARLFKKEVFGFDTFEGLPEETEGLDKHKVGEFKSASLEEMVPYFSKIGVQLVKGIFPKQVRFKHPVAFAHLDVDQYASTYASLIELHKVLSPGGAIVVDDYGWKNCAGVKKAVGEFLAQHPDYTTAVSDRYQIALRKSV